MRIGLLFTYGYSLNTWKESGILNREILFYKKLAEEKNIQFTFFTFGNKSDLLIDLQSKNIEIVPIYELITKSRNKYINLIKSLYIPFKLKKYFTSIDLIKQNQLQGVWIAIILKLLTGLPLFTRTGYDVFKFSIHEKKGLIKIFFYFLLTQIALAFSNLYTVSNKTELNFLKKRFLFSKNILHRPNWIADSGVVDISKRAKYDIISVGRLEKQKNYEELINLFEDSEFEINIVGSGTKKHSLIKLAQQKNVKVNFLGRLENEDLQKVYDNYLFFVTTSKFEGNPKSVLEAMSRGCIVIASNIENHSELITNEQNGYLIPDNCISLSSFIKSLLQNEKKLIDVSLNSKEYVIKNNNINTLCEFEYNDFKELKRN